MIDLSKINTFDLFTKKIIIRKLQSLGDLSKLKVLDIGSGKISIFQKINISHKFKKLTMLDIILNKSKKIHNIEKIKSTIDKMDNYFNSGEFDVVSAFDVVEHLDKKKSLELIKKMKKITSKMIILITPNGFLFQPPAPDNPYQEHKCGYSHEELNNLGFNTEGIIGPKFLRKEFHNLKSPKFLTFIINLFFIFFTRKLLKKYDASIIAVYKK